MSSVDESVTIAVSAQEALAGSDIRAPQPRNVTLFPDRPELLPSPGSAGPAKA
jgi:hypothetical protein